MFFSADAPVCACVHQRYSSKATLYLYVIYEATFIIKTNVYVISITEGLFSLDRRDCCENRQSTT